MFTRRSLIGIAFVSSAIAAMPVLAQDQATVGSQTQTNYSIDGRITAVDPAARTVTITPADGAARTPLRSSGASAMNTMSRSS